MGHCELHRELEVQGIRRGCCIIVHGALKRVGGASVTGQRLDLHSGFVCSLRQPRQPLLCMAALVHGALKRVGGASDTGQRLDLHSGFVYSLRQPRPPLLCMTALVRHGCFMYIDSFKDCLVTPPCY
jgi:hypothetical protein